MEAKEKATEIIRKFYTQKGDIKYPNIDITWWVAQSCAKTAVLLIINAIDPESDKIEYWQEVLKEIDNV